MQSHGNYRTIWLRKINPIKAINRISEITNDVKVEGKVLLDNKNVYDRDVDLVDLRRRVGMVFQRPNPFPKSIYDNVVFGPRLYGVNNKKQLDEIVEYSLTKSACGMKSRIG